MSGTGAECKKEVGSWELHFFAFRTPHRYFTVRDGQVRMERAAAHAQRLARPSVPVRVQGDP
jgi:hypothetical protein